MISNSAKRLTVDKMVFNLNILGHTLSTPARVNGQRNDTKKYSVPIATVHHSSSKYFHVSRPFFSNLLFIIIITNGSIFNSILGKTMPE
jgi:hypothetical protein